MTPSLIEGSGNQTDTSKDYLADLVGEGRKYKTPQDLARSRVEADSFIETLKTEKKTVQQENDTLRQDYLQLKEQYDSRAKMEELIDQLTSLQSTGTQDRGPPRQEDVRTMPTYDPNEIKSLITNSIKEQKVFDKQAENFNQVQNKLKERFGDNYSNVYKQQIDDLDLSVEDMDALARKSPKAFYKTLGLDEQQKQDTYQSPPRTSGDFTPSGGQKRTWTFYQKMKKEQPKLYSNPKTQEQMVNDYASLGKEFEDGNFGHL